MRGSSQDFSPTIDDLERVRQWMLEAFRTQGRPGAEIAREVLVAVTEVFVNVVKHGSLKADDTVRISLDFAEEALVVTFEESGRSFDLAALEDPDWDALQESGYGLFIVKNMMDTLEYFPKDAGDGRNITRLTKGYQHGER